MGTSWAKPVVNKWMTQCLQVPFPLPCRVRSVPSLHTRRRAELDAGRARSSWCRGHLCRRTSRSDRIPGRRDTDETVELPRPRSHSDCRTPASLLLCVILRIPLSREGNDGGAKELRPEAGRHDPTLAPRDRTRPRASRTGASSVGEGSGIKAPSDAFTETPCGPEAPRPLPRLHPAAQTCPEGQGQGRAGQEGVPRGDKVGEATDEGVAHRVTSDRRCAAWDLARDATRDHDTDRLGLIRSGWLHCGE